MVIEQVETFDILYCHPGAEMYGSDRMALETVESLIADGHRVKFLVTEAGELTQELSSRAVDWEIVPVPVVRKSLMRPVLLAKYLAQSIVGFPAAVSMIRRSHARVVYVNTVTQPIWPVAAKICRVACVAHVRENAEKSGSLLSKLLLVPFRTANILIANSHSTESWVRSHVTERHGQRILTIYNGKDWTPYLSERRPALERPLKVVVVGRISPRKGPDIAVRAVAQLVSNGIECRLLLVGSVFKGYEWFHEQLVKMANDYQISDRVDIRSFVSDVGSVIRNHDVLVVPSREEPFGTVALEGLAAGRIVIAAEAQGLREIMTDEVGWTFPVDDVGALCANLEEIVANPEEAWHRAARGVALAQSKFSILQYRTAVAELVRGLL